MICISRGVCDILCTQCSFCVACAVQHCPGGIFGARWRLCRLAIFDDRRSESCIWYAYRVVCVTFCAHSAHFVWPVQYNTALAAFSGPGDAFVAWRFLMAGAVNRAHQMHFAWQAWHSVHTMLILIITLVHAALRHTKIVVPKALLASITYQDKTYQTNRYQDKTYQDKTHHTKTYHANTYQDQTHQDKTYHTKTYQDKTYHTKTYQDKTHQDKTYHTKTYQHNAAQIFAHNTAQIHGHNRTNLWT